MKNAVYIGTFFCCWLGVLLPVSANAGAWPTEKGAGQVISTTLFDNATKGYDDNSDLTRQVHFNKSEGAVYWEHGLTDATTLVTQSSYQDVEMRVGVEDVKFSGLGESYVGLRHALWQHDDWVFAGQAGVLFAGAGEAIADADLGFGSTNYEARLLLGRSFKLAKRDGFLNLQAAYRLRPDTDTGNYPDEWRLDATLGWRLDERVQVLGQGFYTASEAVFEIARANERLKLQGSIVYDWSAKTSYQIGLFQTVAGRNIIKEDAFFLSIWTRY